MSKARTLQPATETSSSQSTSREPKAYVVNMNKDKAIEKAIFGVVEPSQASVTSWEEAANLVTEDGALAPIYDKAMLCRIADMSGPLSESIQVYVTVIEGYGHTFTSLLDPDKEDAYEQVKWALWSRRVRENEDESVEVPEPTQAEILDEIELLRKKVRFQTIEAERFFSNCARHEGRPISMIELRRMLRSDYEKTGEAFVEVLREKTEDGSTGDIRRLQYLPSVGVYRFPLELEKISIEVWEEVDPFTVEKVTESRSFRRYVQIDPMDREKVYFKELGDPRIVSNKTGKIYKSLQDLEKQEPGAMPANELLTWGQHSSLGPYPVPRWVPNSPAIVGTRKAEEVNADYFDNKAIPPAIVMVSGGHLADNADQKIADHFDGLKGAANFHQILVLEAMPFNAGLPGQTPHRTQIELKSLWDRMPNDATHLEYVERNETRISSNFRVPPILRGRSEEYSRATAREALRFFIEMVAQPEQHLFDSRMDTLMRELGLHLVRYKSKGPDTSDPVAMSEILDTFLKHGVIVPAETRKEAERILGRNLAPATADWQREPLQLRIAKVKAEAIMYDAEANQDPTMQDLDIPEEGMSDEGMSDELEKLHKLRVKQAKNTTYDVINSQRWFDS